MLVEPYLVNVNDCQAHLAALPLGLHAMQNTVQGAGHCVQPQMTVTAELVARLVQKNTAAILSATERISTDRRRAVAIALESCAMAAIHAEVFPSITERHQAEDMALQVFLGQLLGGQYSIYGTSPDMHVQGLQLDMSPANMQQPNKQQQEKQSPSIPPQVWKLCGVPASLQQTQLSTVADAVLQLETICCPLDVVTCLQRTDDAIVTAVSEVRTSSKRLGPLSSDALLPLLIVALVLAQPPHLCACLDYVRTFHLHGDWAGQTGFQVATLEAAVTFLQQHMPGQGGVEGSRYKQPEVLRSLSMERTRSEQLLAEITSSLTSVQQPDTEIDETTDTSLLDVESDLPLTFALDSQLLPLHTRSKVDNSCAAWALSLIGL